MTSKTELKGQLIRADIDAGSPKLRLSAHALREPYTLHPMGLHLENSLEPALWWIEGGTNPETMPTYPVYQPLEGCLIQFCQLGQASDQQILEFAGRWGVLGLWPMLRQSCWLPMRAQFVADIEYCNAGEDITSQHMTTFVSIQNKTRWIGERTLVWRRVASQFRSILLIAASLQRDEPAGDDLWNEVLTDTRPAHERNSQKRWAGLKRNCYDKEFMLAADAQRRALSNAVNRWTESITAQAKLEFNQEARAVVQLNLNYLPTIWTPQMYEQAACPLYQEPNLTSEMVFYRENGGLLMRSSVLLNILVMQLVAALSSPLGVCVICGGPLVRDDGRRKVCSKTCSCDRDARRKKAAYKPKREQKPVTVPA